MSYLNEEYEKLSLIGQGANASIWKVRHRTLRYIRAIKELHTVVEDEHAPAYTAFLNECGLLLRIGNGGHPNIVRIYRPRLIDHKAIVEMDYVDGLTVNEYVSDRRFVEAGEVMRFIREMAGALAYCHVDIYKDLMNPEDDHLQRDPEDARRFVISPEEEKALIEKYGIVHNDLHSNNIMRRNRDGSFILLDFGLAIQQGHSVKSSARRDGAVEYKAPEKWDDDNLITPMSDIYSFGVLLFEMLTGTVPFKFNNPESYGMRDLLDIMNRHKTAPVPAIEPLRKAAFEQRNPGKTYVKDYPDWLEHVVSKCLEKKPENRYRNAKELLDEINRLDQASLSFEQQEADRQTDLIALLRRFVDSDPDIKAADILRQIAGTDSEEAIVVEEPIDEPAAQSYVVNADGVLFQMVRIDGGKFTMGAAADLLVAGDEERPAHDVFVKTFHMGATQVTQRLWEQVMGSNPSRHRGNDRPVETVSWDDCQVFLNRLNRLTGHRFRLPTEEEWEYAARGGIRNHMHRFSGSDTVEEVGWWRGNSGMETHDVAQKRPNELGLYDMSGNVFEWCDSWYSPYDNPLQKTGGKVRRGGCWNSDSNNCRVSFRYDSPPDKRSQIIGFRIVE